MQHLLTLVGEHLDEMVERSVTRVQRDTPQFAGLPPEEMRPAIRAGFVSALAAFREDRPASAAELAELAGLGAHRAEQGIPLQALVQGFRQAARVVIEAAHDYNDRYELNVHEADLHAVTQRVWEWVVDALAVASEAHHSMELELARLDSGPRADFIRRLLLGSLGRADTMSLAPRHGLDPSRVYRAFRAPLDGPRARQRLERMLGSSALHEVIDGDLAGVLLQPPNRSPDLIALGLAVPLTSIADSFAQATLALETARLYGLEGDVDIGDVAARAGSITGRALAEIAYGRCFASLPQPRDQRWTFEATLTAHLAHDLRFEDTARELHVHPNTLRYRIRRFEELSGLRVDHTEDTVTIWWALQHLRVNDTPESRK
ncbi:PucR family transcriptional regulator [Streptomyces sp. NBC_01244]|uniref:PucR family transcriptional regulator n=1 Tax=Streptomyces sp. NBC_01244 TaxID=2903797 RepID=UPI002E0D74A0|nr:helix-turn-helix domain-containing protein [Streptomyces sp. NBC_01244]